MSGITKQTVFMLILYIVLIIIMFSFVGINIQSGAADNMTKKLAWVLYGCALVSSLVCILSLRKFDGRFKHKRNMFIGGISLFATITAALVISKPSENTNFKAITYSSIGMVTLVNLIATFYLIDSSVKITPSFNSSIINKLSQIANRPGISPTQSSQLAQVQQLQTESFPVPTYSPQPTIQYK